MKRAISAEISAGNQTAAVRSLQSLLDLAGVVDPRIVGSGLYFRFWSRRLRLHVQQFIRQDAVSRILPLCGSFTSPVEVTVARNASFSTAGLDEAVSSLRRVMGTVFFKFPKLYFHPNEVKGLGFQRKRLECHSPGKWGQYELRCDGTGRDFASFIQNRATRDTILREYFKVFNASSELPQAVLQVLRERKRFAQSLGFTSWSEMQAMMNGYEPAWTRQFVDELWRSGQPGIKNLVARMRSFPTDVEGTKPSVVTTTDEQFLLNCVRAPLEFKKEKIFEYSKTLERIVSLVGIIFGVTFTPVTHSLWAHGWNKEVKVYRVDQLHGDHQGYIYVDLFRRPMSSPLAGAGPHCSVLSPSDSHVRIFMGLHPPYRSDVTFKKERFFSYEEITALMHELGHAMHILLRPNNSPISQLPLDMRETVSVFTELFSLTPDAMDAISDNKLNAKDKAHLKRDEWFYVDIIRNVAVAEHIHSEAFDPDTASSEDLVKVSRDLYAKYSPVKLAELFNPLGGELANYLVDGESRIGYLVSYARASSILRSKNMSVTEAMGKLQSEFIQRSFEPSVSHVLETRKSGISKIQHPLPLPTFGRLDNNKQFGGEPTVAALWERIPSVPVKSKN